MPKDMNYEGSLSSKGRRIPQLMVLAALLAIGAVGIIDIGQPPKVAHANDGDHHEYGGAQGGIAHDVSNPYNSANTQAIGTAMCGACGGGGAGSSGTAANNSSAPGQGPGNHDGSQGTPFAWLMLVPPQGVQLT
jgi:hypothetical protein